MKWIFAVLALIFISGCSQPSVYQVPTYERVEKMKESNRYGLIYKKVGSKALIKTEEGDNLEFNLIDPFRVGDRVRLHYDGLYIYKVEVVK